MNPVEAWALRGVCVCVYFAQVRTPLDTWLFQDEDVCVCSIRRHLLFALSGSWVGSSCFLRARQVQTWKPVSLCAFRGRLLFPCMFDACECVCAR